MRETDKQITEAQTTFVSMLKDLTSDDEAVMESLNNFIGMLEG